MADAVNLGNEAYQGGCHCGAVRFRFTGPDALEVLSCNCSICSVTGYLHVTVPHTAFELLTPLGALSDYRFGTGAAGHLFCRVCGIKSFYQPRSHPDCWSVNLRCVEGGEAHIGRFEQYDGRNWEAARGKL